MSRLLHIRSRKKIFLRPQCSPHLRSTTRYMSWSIVKNPPSSAPREAPVPLVFPTIKGWHEQEGKHGLFTYSTMLRELGFTTVEVGLELDSRASEKSIEDLVREYAKELRSEISLASIFPPVLIARGVSTLAVHAYVESYPVSGIGLIGPISLVPNGISLPETNRLISGTSIDKSNPEAFPIPKFNYEATFPICLIESLNVMKNTGGDCGSESWMKGEFFTVEGDLGLRDEAQVYEILRSWLDKIGV